MNEAFEILLRVQEKIKHAIENEDAPLSFDLIELAMLKKALDYATCEWWERSN